MEPIYRETGFSIAGIGPPESLKPATVRPVYKVEKISVIPFAGLLSESE